MINLYLYWLNLSFTHSHEYIYDTKMYAVIFAVTQQITMEYAGKTPFLKQGGTGSALGICQLLWSTNILSKELLLH